MSAGGLGVLVGDHAGHRLARREERSEISRRLPMTIVTAIVSPSARPRPRMIAPKMPARGGLEHRERIISQRVAPSASAASRWARGTALKTSREIDEIVGSDHDRQDQPGGEHADAVGRALEERQETRVASLSTGSTRRAQPGRQDENAPEAVDHARDRGQHLDQEPTGGDATRARARSGRARRRR